MKTMRYFNFILILAITGLMYSCYPKGAEYVDELDAYISKYDPDFFNENATDTIKKYNTFALPDEISYYKDGKLVDDHEHDYDAEVLYKIKEKMTGVGFTEVHDFVDTALVISVESHELTNGGYIYPPDWGYWDPWYPGYPGGWQPWYPWNPGGWYPWYPTYYTFQTGTLIINIGNVAKLETIGDTVRVPVIYIGAIDGLLQGSDQYIKDRVDNGIDQLFEQAPFDKIK